VVWHSICSKIESDIRLISKSHTSEVEESLPSEGTSLNSVGANSREIASDSLLILIRRSGLVVIRKCVSIQVIAESALEHSFKVDTFTVMVINIYGEDLLV